MTRNNPPDSVAGRRWEATVALVIVLLGGCRQRPAPLSLPTLRERLSRATDARASLELVEAIKCRELGERLLRAGATPHRLPALDRVPLPRLAEDEAVLSLFVDGARLRRFWARGPALVRELEARDLARLEPLVARARDELELGENLRGSTLDRLLAEAATALLEGVDLSPVRRLLVVPHGLTGALPFQALPRAGEPLVSGLDLAYLPCLGLLRPSRAPAGYARARVLIPSYGHERQPLPGAATEVAELEAAPGYEATVILGPAATAVRLVEELAAPVPLLHFGGHGLGDLQPRGGQGPLLVFPNDQPSVDVTSATRRPVGVGLVVLASCATAGAARFRDGQRLLAEVTLPDALLAAGAERVVAAAWAVKDRQSALQMATFYHHLRRSGPAAALALAQRQARAGIEPPHPRFWAFYSLHGGW